MAKHDSQLHLRSRYQRSIPAAKMHEKAGISRHCSEWSTQARRIFSAGSDEVVIERGTGAVFEDLGFSPGEANNLQLRAQLMSKIRAEARDMTQTQAARLFDVTLTRIDDLRQGRIDKFSLDALVAMSTAAGLRINMVVKKVT